MKKALGSIGIKSLSVLLSVLMVIAIFPLSVCASWIEGLGDHSPSSDDLQATPLTTDVEAIREPFELTELREEKVKYFQNTDGTRVAAMYEVPVHYLDESGSWQ